MIKPQWRRIFVWIIIICCCISFYVDVYGERFCKVIIISMVLLFSLFIDGTIEMC